MNRIAPSPSRAIALGFALLATTGCSKDSSGPPAVATVEVTLASLTMVAGTTAQASVVVKDASGTALTGRTVTWSSSNTGVATISGTSQSVTITAVAAGTTTISVNSEGRTGSAQLTVNAAVASVQLVLANGAVAIGGTVQATATPKDGTGAALAGRTGTFASSNASVATVNVTTGLVTTVAAGSTQISATIEGVTGSATLAVCLAAFTPPAAATVTVHVSATAGNDATGTGSCAEPYKTVTKGVNGTASGTVVRVAPGVYNAALGEVFPIMLPTGVQLIGDEPNKGQGASVTRIIGGANLALTGPCSTFGTTVYAGTNAVIAGFELTNNVGTFAQMTLTIRNNGVVIRNNSLVNNAGNNAVVYLCNGSQNQVITGNRIRNNPSATGLAFINGGAGARVENNSITLNAYGVEYDSPGGDMGGGATGSVGGNSIFCNAVNDLWTNTLITINAANNFWYHVPLSGNDLFNGSGATLVTTGATVAAGNCP